MAKAANLIRNYVEQQKIWMDYLKPYVDESLQTILEIKEKHLKPMGCFLSNVFGGSGRPVIFPSEALDSFFPIFPSGSKRGSQISFFPIFSHGKNLREGPSRGGPERAVRFQTNLRNIGLNMDVCCPLTLEISMFVAPNPGK